MSSERNAKALKAQAEFMLELLQNPAPNYIFGCGWMGEKFLSAVQALSYQVDGFVVSEKKVSEKYGIPVYSLNEMIQTAPITGNIFIALRDQDEALTERLKQMFAHVYEVTYPRDITLAETAYYLDYFEKKQIDCTTSSLKLEDFTFINPFEKPDDYLLSFVYEAGDLVLPVIFDDESRIDEGSYEREHTMLEEGDVVLDCGSNIGLFANVAVQKGCEVYAFEPMPAAIAYLQELCKTLNGKMEICPYALADKCGTVQFHVQNFDLLGASMFEGHNSVDQNYDVEVTTIDQFVKERDLKRVDYIKADIEGSERDMLRGAAETIRRFRPKISICTYHLPDDKQVLEQLLRDIEPRYVIEHQWKKLYAYVPEKE